MYVSAVFFLLIAKMAGQSPSQAERFWQAVGSSTAFNLIITKKFRKKYLKITKVHTIITR